MTASAAQNKALWDKVCKTDPRAVKPITGKQYQGNSPKPYWLIERATEVFGPVGIGWGCDVKSERFERLGEFDVLHVAVVSVWYVVDGVRSQTFDQMGGTKAAYKTAKGTLMVDEDAGKKSVTDGMVKCLSMIGFAGDIFSGRWDDSKYVADMRKEFETKEEADHRAHGPSLIFAELQPEEQDRCRKIAAAVIEAGNDMTKVLFTLDMASLDNEMKIGVWSLLDSKTRANIKTAQVARDKAPALAAGQ